MRGAFLVYLSRAGTGALGDSIQYLEKRMRNTTGALLLDIGTQYEPRVIATDHHNSTRHAGGTCKLHRSVSDTLAEQLRALLFSQRRCQPLPLSTSFTLLHRRLTAPHRVAEFVQAHL